MKREQILSTYGSAIREHSLTVRFSEKGKTYVGVNKDASMILEYSPDHMTNFRRSGRGRCDRLFFKTEGDQAVYLVELKGGDLRRAIQQICETYEDMVTPYHKTILCLAPVHARVVARCGVPKGAKMHELAKLRSMVTSLLIRKNRLEESI